jgi:integrase
LAPQASYEGAWWVAQDRAQRAAGQGPTTKTAAQVVPARTLYALGFDLMAEARETRTLGLDAARLYRNGLLISVAAALPQRARALSALDLASTFRPVDRPLIEVRLPGRVLKMRERFKAMSPFQTTLQSGRLWDAVDEYRRVYRPMFDAGSALFPSVHERGASISGRRIGQLVGDLTEARLGVRVPVHRVRDCVATEASEELVHGGLLAPALLGHHDEATAGRHYDHAEGIRATDALASRMQARQSRRPALQV